jgi:hypothetical protein
MNTRVVAGEVEFRWTNPMEGAFVYVWPKACGAVVLSTETKTGVADEGMIKVPMSELLDAAPPAGGTCVTVGLARIMAGTIDPAFDQDSTSELEARRQDDFDIMIVP